MTQEGAKKFLDTFEKYVAGSPQPEDTNMTSVMAWTYSKNEPAWPPRRFTGGTNNTLAGSGALSDWGQPLQSALNIGAEAFTSLFRGMPGNRSFAFPKTKKTDVLDRHCRAIEHVGLLSE